MTEKRSENDNSASTEDAPVAALLCADLMFAVQLQNMARAAGLRPLLLRAGARLPDDAAVLVVNVGERAGPQAWEASMREAASNGIPIIAFGPHMDAESRRAAKAAGASRVLANSNLARDLPTILREIRSNSNHDYSTEG